MRVSIGLEKFRKLLASKPVDTSKLQIRPGEHVHYSLATGLLRTTLGVEGMEVFSTLFQDPQVVESQISSQQLQQIQSLLSSKYNNKNPSQDKASDNTSLILKVANVLYPSNIPTQILTEHQHVTSSAGWRLSTNNWIEVSSHADSCLFQSTVNPARAQSFFSDADNNDTYANSSYKINVNDLDMLTKHAPFRCFRGGGIDFYHSVVNNATESKKFLSLGIFDANLISSSFTKNILSELDSRALLFMGTSLVQQALLYSIDTPQIAYSVITHGSSWRFLAFQLNTLDFEGNLHPNHNTPNAAWIYDSPLFAPNDTNLESARANSVSVEPIAILHNILSKC